MISDSVARRRLLLRLLFFDFLVLDFDLDLLPRLYLVNIKVLQDGRSQLALL